MFIFISVLAFLVIRPFFTAVLSAGILAYLFYPFYQIIYAKVKNKNISAFIVILVLILVIIIPFLFLISNAWEEGKAVLEVVKEGNIAFSSSFCEESSSITCLFINGFAKLRTNENFLVIFNKFHIEDIYDFLLKIGADFIKAVPLIILNIFITLFIIYYLLKDAKDIKMHFQALLPISIKYKKRFAISMHRLIYGIIYGQLSVSLIQGSIAALGYFIIGIPSPIFWGLITAFFALIPVFGTAIVWVPAAFILFLKGLILSETALIFKGIILFIYCLIIVSNIDNLIRPKLIGDKAKIHPIIVLVGVLGGIKLFGIMGLIIGPILLALFLEFFNIIYGDY